MSDELKELIVSNDAINEPAELQRRMADEGYLFFRHLQAPDKLRELRLEMMTTLQKVGWLVHDTDPMEGIADVSTQCTEGDNEYSAGYAEVYKLESFHRSAHWPEVISMVEKIAGQEIMPHPHKIARIWYPQYTDHTTPTHQDFVHFSNLPITPGSACKMTGAFMSGNWCKSATVPRSSAVRRPDNRLRCIQPSVPSASRTLRQNSCSAITINGVPKRL